MKNSFLGCGRKLTITNEDGENVSWGCGLGDLPICEKCQGKKEALDKVEAIFPIYIYLISKERAWRLGADELCNEIEDKIKEKIQELREAE